MKLRLFAVLSLMTVLMMSSCGKEDNLISYVEPEPENESPAGNMDIEGMDLSSYKPQKEFSLTDVTLSKASYNTGKTYQKVVGIGAMLTPKGWAPSPSTGQIDVL